MFVWRICIEEKDKASPFLPSLQTGRQVGRPFEKNMPNLPDRKLRKKIHEISHRQQSILFLFRVFFVVVAVKSRREHYRYSDQKLRGFLGGIGQAVLCKSYLLVFVS